MELGGSGAVERALAEHVKLGSAVHAALDELQPIHRPFDVALTPRGGHRCRHRREVLPSFGDEGLGLWERALLRLLDPGHEPLNIVLAEHPPKARQQGIGTRNLGMDPAQRGPDCRLLCRQVFAMSPQQSHRLAWRQPAPPWEGRGEQTSWRAVRRFSAHGAEGFLLVLLVLLVLPEVRDDPGPIVTRAGIPHDLAPEPAIALAPALAQVGVEEMRLARMTGPLGAGGQAEVARDRVPVDAEGTRHRLPPPPRGRQAVDP